MLEGRIHLTQNPPWLNELIPIDGKFYVPYPPMPAIVLLPFALVFGEGIKQQILAHFMGAGIALMSGVLAFQVQKNKTHAIWIGILAAFGTVIWYTSSVGSSWYLGQLTAAFFLTAALLESQVKKRPAIVGVFLGAAYLSRIHTVLSVVFFVYIFRREIKKIIQLFSGLLPFLIFNAFYNYARFGVFWDKGYVLIPGVLDEPWYKFGIIHPGYITRHLKVIFTALPVIKEKFPYIFPSLDGLAIWITTPALVFSLFAPFKKPVVKAAVLAAGLIALPVLMHGTFGFAQFGYRFIIDFIPFIFFILAHALPKKLRLWHWALLVVSVLVNLWGVVWINKFDWVA